MNDLLAFAVTVGGRSGHGPMTGPMLFAVVHDGFGGWMERYVGVFPTGMFANCRHVDSSDHVAGLLVGVGAVALKPGG